MTTPSGAKIHVLIMAGGTGGHVFPALAVADQIRATGAEVSWLGTRRGLEADVVPRAGYDIHFISINGLRGKNVLTLLLAPFKLGVALSQALVILLRLRPAVVLGMGGFASGPGGVMASFLGRPLLIHEQNAIAGMTNRMLAKFSWQVMQAFPDTFPEEYKPVTVGNPVREAISNLPAPEQRFAGREGPLRLLVLGGSLGAVALNKTVPTAIGFMSPDNRPEVLHQSGKGNQESALDYYKNINMNANVVPFVEKMEDAYGWADLVVCRAGALTIAELAAAGVASILVPYPHAVDDHQTANARTLTQAGAALLVPQEKLTPDYLSDVLQSFAGKDMVQVRQRLLKMAQAARKLAQPDATQKVAKLCFQAARKRSKTGTSKGERQ
jgi:UDP-N-acetylglucosamine--N-acetylmuramyl-(pentapeptide) pyrophosphoryl-undecaprenol N-acetylglucosamine transferase